jgi:hypothetical protein
VHVRLHEGVLVGKKQFTGNERFLMFLCKDVRRRWMQYGENRPYNLSAAKNWTKCNKCELRATEWDHIDPVGTRAYTLEELVPYMRRMIYGKCQPLCTPCNSKKGAKK